MFNDILTMRINEELDKSKKKQVYNNIKTIQSPQGRYITINNQKFLNLCSNNYLGLANDKDIIKSAIESISKYGIGNGAVRSISGTMQIHLDFESRLAHFKGVQDVLVVQSGYQANVTLLPTIISDNDCIISDELNHASIIDAIKLSKGKKYIYKHKDIDDLEKQIKIAEEEIEGIKLIITDGVFSMDGDIADLKEIVKLKKKYANIYIAVDDAHGEGVLGKHGRGLVDHLSVQNDIDFEIGTLSKAFGIAGGFIGGKKEVIDYLRQRSRPFLFSTGLDIAMCGAGIKAIDILEGNDDLINKLWMNTIYFQKKLIDLGFDLGNTQTPITPIITKSESKATIMSQKLFEQNILVSPIIYPTVPKNTGRIRLMISAKHTKKDLDNAIEIITKIGQELELI